MSYLGRNSAKLQNRKAQKYRKEKHRDAKKKKKEKKRKKRKKKGASFTLVSDAGSPQMECEHFLV